MHCFDRPPQEKKVNFNQTAYESLMKATPPLGAENLHFLFRKYGYTYTGICDGWNWYPIIKEATDEELWLMSSLCNEYWCKFYEWVNNEKEYINYKKALREWVLRNKDFQQTIDLLEEEEKKLGLYERFKIKV